MGFGADHTSEFLAESTVSAAATGDAVEIGVGLADVGGGYGKRVIADGFGGVAEEGGEIRNFGRGSGVFLAAPAFEDVAAIDFLAAEISGFAGSAEEFVDFGVVGLEFVVGDAPIADGMICGESGRAIFFGGAGEQFETVGLEAGALGIPVFTGAAYASTGQEGAMLAKWEGALVGVVAEGDSVLGEVLHHVEADGVVQFVHGVGVIGGLASGATFKNDDVERGASAEFFGHEKAGPTAANDDDVYGGERFHGSSSSGWYFAWVA